MPSLACGSISCTAWASTCAVEWRSTSRPSCSAAVTGSTVSPSARTCARSRSSPLTRATRTARSSPNRSAAVVCSGTDRSLPAILTVIWADTFSLLVCGGAGLVPRRLVLAARCATRQLYRAVCRPLTRVYAPHPRRDVDSTPSRCRSRKFGRAGRSGSRGAAACRDRVSGRLMPHGGSPRARP